MANFVKSVEELLITLPDENQVDVDFTKSQDKDDCVPFASLNMDTNVGPQNRYRYSQVFFTAGTPDKVSAVRTAGNGEIIVNAFVVEFDTAVVTIQQGTFTIADTASTGVAAISAVTLTKAFIVLNWDHAAAQSSSSWSDGQVKVVFNSTTELGFSRGTTAGLLTGRWYVVSTTGTDFAVTHEAIAMSSTEELKELTITAITLASTFIVPTHSVDGGSDDVRTGSIVTDLKSTTLLRARRAFDDFGDDTADGAASAAGDVACSVISVSGGEFTVERAECNWGNSVTKDTTISAIDQARSIIIAGGHMGCMSSAEFSSGELEGNYGYMGYTSTTNVRGLRATNTAPDGTTMFEAIEFVLAVAGAAGHGMLLGETRNRLAI